MAMPVASVEEEGPLGLLQRSWALTSGHWLKLFGFLIIFMIGAVVVLLAVQMVMGSLTALMFDSRGPMSLAALISSLVQAIATGIFSVLFTLMLARIYVQLSGRTTIEKGA
jgi:ABC-type Fe3+ transport system permease subunit